MKIEELKNASFDWRLRNGWPISLTVLPSPNQDFGTVFLQEFPSEGKKLTEEWAEFLKNQGVELEYQMGEEWTKSECEYLHTHVYRIPLPALRMRNKRLDELPYSIVVFYPSGKYWGTISKHQEGDMPLDQKEIDNFAKNGWTYTTNGTDRHSFQVEVKDGE